MANASEQASTVFNKIIIPVITTVLGATAIYFLGFNKKNNGGRTDMEKMLITKEATVKAWKSFVTTQNIYYKNAASIVEDYSQKVAETSKGGAIEKLVPVWRDFEKELAREAGKVDQDVEDILKDEDIDRDFISMLKRALDNGKDDKKKTAEFFDNIVAVARSDRDDESKKQELAREIQQFVDMGKKRSDRITTEAEAIGKILAEKYSQAFDLNELLAYAEYKKEKENKPDETKGRIDANGPAPVDPQGGKDIKDNPPSDDNAASYGTNTTSSNEVEPTEILLTGYWTFSSGEMELHDDGYIYWIFEGRGYTSGDWRLVNGKLRLDLTNPDTGEKKILVGSISSFTKKSFTLTFPGTPREVYNFRRKN